MTIYLPFNSPQENGMTDGFIALGERKGDSQLFAER
jgi:hypothetical protein